MTATCRGRGCIGYNGNYINELLIIYQAVIISSGQDHYRLNLPDGSTTSRQSWLPYQSQARETLEDTASRT